MPIASIDGSAKATLIEPAAKLALQLGSNASTSYRIEEPTSHVAPVGHRAHKEGERRCQADVDRPSDRRRSSIRDPAADALPLVDRSSLCEETGLSASPSLYDACVTAPQMPVPVVVAYGTRPEAIKMAPVVLALQASTTLQPVVVVSGQHREMLASVNDLFEITPFLDFDVIQPGQSLTGITNRVLSGYSRYFDKTPPKAVVVQGDTTTTFAAALAAFYHQIPVVHVEAGLRTGNPRSPYPEEINRRLTTQLTDLHLAPTPLNRDNLLRDGISSGNIRITGNTVIDAFLEVTSRKSPVGEPAIDAAIAAGRRILLVTAHRRES